MAKLRISKKLAICLVCVLLAGASTALAAEEAIRVAISELQSRMAVNRANTERDRLDLLVLEQGHKEAENEASKIFNTGLYLQGYDNTVIRDILPKEAKSRIEAEKRSQEREPLLRDAALFKAIQSLKLARARLQSEALLVELTAEALELTEAQYRAGVIPSSEAENARANLRSEKLGLEKLAISVDSAVLEVNRLAGTSFDTSLEETTAADILLLETEFSDINELPQWISSAQESDPSIFSQEESLRFLDLRLELAEDFLPVGHSRIIELKRDREDVVLDLADMKVGKEVDLRNKLNDRLTAVENLELAMLDMEMANRRKALADARYAAGVIRKTDIINTQKELISSGLAVVSATAALNSQEVDLRVLVGSEVFQK